MAKKRKAKRKQRWFRISGRTVSRLKKLLRRHNVEMGVRSARTKRSRPRKARKRKR